MTAQTALAPALRARLRPLVALVFVVVWLAAPLGYAAWRLDELRAQGDALVAQVAQLVEQHLAGRPALGRYDTIKLSEHLRAVAQASPDAAMALNDGRNALLDLGGATRAVQRAGTVWTKTATAMPNGETGAVWVGLPAGPVLQRAGILALLTGLLAWALAAALRWVALGTAEHADGHIATLLATVEATRQDLAVANHQLENQVAERSRQLAVALEELQAKEQRLRSQAARAVSLHAAERRAIARDLHDSLGQSLTVVRLRLQLLQSLPAVAPEQVQALLALVDDALGQVRAVLRQLAPPLLTELGLVGALLRLAADLQEQSGLIIAIAVQGEPPADPGAEAAAYRIVQEALTNVVRHARATSVAVTIDTTGAALVLSIQDDGGGFDPQVRPSGLGLAGMHERAELLGGALTVASAVGQGCTISATLPLRADGGTTRAAPVD